MKTEEKILLIRLSSLGDAVLATAALEALRAQRPQLRVDILTKSAFGEVFATHPSVGKVIFWENGDSPLKMASILRKEGYWRVFDLHRNLRTKLLRLFLRGPKWRVYHKGAVRRRIALFFRAKSLLWNADHVTRRYVEALSPLGVGESSFLPRLYPSEGDAARAREALLAGGWDGKSKIFAFAPGARWQTKKWPAEKWIDLAKSVSSGTDAFIAVVGAQNEAGECEIILRESSARGAILAGKLSLMETAALLGMSAALVTNDSAPMHMATAVGTPVLAIFGPTVKGFGFYPLGPRDQVVERKIACRPCALHGKDKCPLGHFACMREIDPSSVYGALLKAAGEGESR